MNPKYLKAVRSIAKMNATQQKQTWNCPFASVNGILFRFVTKDGRHKVNPKTFRHIGCLTQIAIGANPGPNTRLTAAIRKDKRLHIDMQTRTTKLTKEELMALAEWQDKLDREYRKIA